METFGNYLAEAQEINLAMKALKTLSYEAKSALNQWESYGWRTGTLQRAYQGGNSEIKLNIDTAFQPVRDWMKSKYGSTIKLYRGMQKDPHFDPKQYDVILTSWTTDKRIAEIFAGLRPSSARPEDLRKPLVLYRVRSQQEIDAAVAQFERVGYVKLGTYSYKLNKNNPKYYDIWNGTEHLTDGDTAHFRKMLEDRARENKEYNDEKLSKTIILERQIPVDKIVWILNTVNCKEFIVRNA